MPATDPPGLGQCGKTLRTSGRCIRKQHPRQQNGRKPHERQRGGKTLLANRRIGRLRRRRIAHQELSPCKKNEARGQHQDGSDTYAVADVRQLMKREARRDRPDSEHDCQQPGQQNQLIGQEITKPDRQQRPGVRRHQAPFGGKIVAVLAEVIDRLGLRFPDLVGFKSRPILIEAAIRAGLLRAVWPKLLCDVVQRPFALDPRRQPTADISATGNRRQVVAELQQIELGKALQQPQAKRGAAYTSSGEGQTNQSSLFGRHHLSGFQHLAFLGTWAMRIDFLLRQRLEPSGLDLKELLVGKLVHRKMIGIGHSSALRKKTLESRFRNAW